MKHRKYKDKFDRDRKNSKKGNKRRNKKEDRDDSSSSNSGCDNEMEWVEKSESSRVLTFENTSAMSSEREPLKREAWMDMRSDFPCSSKEKKSESSNSNKYTNKPDLDKLGQSGRELNPYWRHGGNGLPKESLIKKEHVMDVKWLKKSLHRAKEQAASENRCLEEIVAERWGSLDVLQSMIADAECKSRKTKDKSQFRNDKQHERCDDSDYENSQKQNYKKPVNNDYLHSISYKTNHTGKKNWQKIRVQDEAKQADSVQVRLQNDKGMEETKKHEFITESDMNKLGAKIVKAEIMGNMKLAEELKLQLRRAREGAKPSRPCNSKKIEDVILTRTDEKGVTRPLDRRSCPLQTAKSSKRKNVDTYMSGKKVRHYFDDDKYSLQQLFQREKGRSIGEDQAAFINVASKNMDMEEVFEERITHVKSAEQQDMIDRSTAIKEYKRFSKSVDSCHWCIDSEYMLKHMVIAMDSNVYLSLPRHTSLTAGHCIITPTEHIACQLQLDENVWEKLKLFKSVLYKMFAEQNQYPVFYEIYKSRFKFPHMRLECVPLPRKIGELAPMYFKKALLECETEWSMNKKIIDLEKKDIRRAIPNGLSYFMVEFETNKGYAHIIEDEHMFPKNFAEEVIGGMLDLEQDVWRKPGKLNFDQQREKVLAFVELWKKYECEIKTN